MSSQTTIAARFMPNISFSVRNKDIGKLTLPFIAPLLVFLGVGVLWYIVSHTVAPLVPDPIKTYQESAEFIWHPFYDYGPNDKGLGWQVLLSLQRVAIGFFLASAVAIPLGFLIGSSQLLRWGFDPLIQLLKPVSPLAWLPLGLAVFQAADPSAIFTIFITSLWPTVANTAFGVRSLNPEYRNVARVLNLSRWTYLRKILLPATMPYIMTGLRISLSIAWLVIVAAEMLTGGVGIGFFAWDSWNNLNLAHVILAILVIGSVGFFLDRLMGMVETRFKGA
ncbi:MAG: nitrate ABC transporter permease [Candidatus Binatia bacterium]